MTGHIWGTNFAEASIQLLREGTNSLFFIC